MYTKNIPMYIFTWYVIAEFVPLIFFNTSTGENIAIRFIVMLIVWLYFEEFLKNRIKKMKEKNKRF